MSFSLIVPAAADKEAYKNELPEVFQTSETGIMYCIEAIRLLNTNIFDRIYITILRSQDERYSLTEKLNKELAKENIDNTEIVVLDTPTMSEPETIYQTIRKKGISGGIFIKDADCAFTGEVIPGNHVTIFPLESLSWVNPQHKSYVAVDDMYYVTNIIEKKVVSHYFSAGGYGFQEADDFVRYYNRFTEKKGLFLSHIIFSMLLDKKVFRPIIADTYIDFETCLK